MAPTRPHALTKLASLQILVLYLHSVTYAQIYYYIAVYTTRWYSFINEAGDQRVLVLETCLFSK